MEEILNARKAEIGTEDWQTILDASAYVGEIIRYHHGGNWGWNQDYNTAAIMDIGTPKRVFNTLIRVARFWGKPTFQPYSIVLAYDGIK